MAKLKVHKLGMPPPNMRPQDVSLVKLGKLRESMDSCDSLVKERIDNVKVPIKDIKKAVDLFLREEALANQKIPYKLPERHKLAFNHKQTTSEIKQIISKTVMGNGIFTKTNNITVSINPEKRLISKYDRNT